CGAGGGRMWLEETIGQRINQNRVEEAAKTLGEKGLVATSCPFCLTMIKDGISETGRAESMQAKDIAELVAEAIAGRGAWRAAGAGCGLSDDADVGVKAGPAGASLDLNYALVNSPGVVVSIAPGGGVLYVNNGGNPSSSLTTLNLFLPLLFGVRSGTTEVVFGAKLPFTHVQPTP